MTDEQYESIYKPMRQRMDEMKARDGITAEDDAKVNEWRKANPEEAKQEFMATWGAADTDQNGLIDRTEYNSLVDMMVANAKARHGKDAKPTDEDKDFMYDLMNKITPDIDGISMMDMGILKAGGERYAAEGN